LTSEQIRDCHEENIHLCGAVQTFGALVVVKEARDNQYIAFASGMKHAEWRVSAFASVTTGPKKRFEKFVADNAAEIFGCDKALLHSGRMRVINLLGHELEADISNFYLSPRPFIVRNTPELHLSMHKLGDLIVVEAEPSVCPVAARIRLAHITHPTPSSHDVAPRPGARGQPGAERPRRPPGQHRLHAAQLHDARRRVLGHHAEPEAGVGVLARHDIQVPSVRHPLARPAAGA
jgi:hypothetical protein